MSLLTSNTQSIIQPNLEQLSETIQRQIDAGEPVVVIYFDIDDFQQHQRHHLADADEFLAELHHKLAHHPLVKDVCRVMADQFVLYSTGSVSHQKLKSLQAVINDMLSCAVSTGDIKFSAGISFSPAHSTSAVKLINYAQCATFESKAKGKSQVEIFDIEAYQQEQVKVNELGAIADGLRNSEFVMYAQPKYRIQTGEVYSFELLMRWQHPDKGLLSPKSFIPLICGSELDLAFGEYALFKAIEYLRQGQRLGKIPHLSINLSPKQVMSEQFLGLLEYYAQYDKQLISHLTFEILETELGVYLPKTLAILQKYRQLGLKIALDDFGSGYSSILSMFELPLDELKIDRHLITNLHLEPKKQSLLQYTILVAQQYGLSVVAEGVESEQEASVLRQLGCDSGQGFYYHRPAPAEDLIFS
ncbi:GGDEF domain-containing phosphodiesterase [Idiomarina seosinensis]|uniref:EAL domain-containing protein n=1 Tax=Idiomarina seosinensis TaxID=281739 RepID=UPI00384BA7B1